MSSLKLVLKPDAENPNPGDLQLTNGTLRLTASLSEEVAQAIWTRLRMFKGEWFLDPDTGMPYFQAILGVKTSLGVVTQIFRNAVAKTPGVAQVLKFITNRTADRTFSLEFAVKLADGSILTQASFGRFLVPGVA